MGATMRASVRDGLSLWYRTPAASVARLLPAGLETVVRGPWAFWNVALWRLEQTRPEGVPAYSGVTYHEVSYRLLAQAMDDRAELVRGMYTVRSDAVGGDDTMAEGSRARVRIESEADDAAVAYRVTGTAWGAGDAAVRVEAGPAERPEPSCFPTLLDAQELLGVARPGLAVDKGGLRVMRLDYGGRPPCETVVRAAEVRLDFFTRLDGSPRVLELATRWSPCEVRWGEEERRLLGGGPLQHDGTPRSVRAPLAEAARMNV